MPETKAQSDRPQNGGRNSLTIDELRATFRRLFDWLPDKPHIALAAVIGALCVPAAIYLAYDLTQQHIAPCDAIFRQTETAFSAKIGFLKADGAIQLGRSKVAELSDRAQMTALNLKTCCTALDHGRLNPEQFLSCKEKTRAYDDQISELITLVKDALPKAVTVAAVPTGAAAHAAPKLADIERQEKIKEKVTAATKISKEFNKEVVAVAKSEALRKLEITPPSNVDVKGEESEPNNTLLKTNTVPMGETISGAVGTAKDYDFFLFQTPPKYRDWITIKLENRSTTLEPRFIIYNKDKQELAAPYSTTRGADLQYSLVAAPESKFFVRVSNYHGNSTGLYLLTVTPAKAYDEFEPNDGLLTATAATLNSPTTAKIMDGKDVDMFVFDTSNVDDKAKLTIKLENRSTTLHPRFYIYNASKTNFASPYNTTPGADLAHTVNGNQGGKLYVAVRDYHGSAAGEYSLDVSSK